MSDYDEGFNTQRDVEQNPCGAWQAIQELTAEREAERQRAERAESERDMLRKVLVESLEPIIGEYVCADLYDAERQRAEEAEAGEGRMRQD